MSASDKIGKIVGASNWLQFFCVGISAFLLFLLNEWMGLTPLQSFMVVGLGALILSFTFMQRLSSYLFALIAKAIFMPLHRVSYTGMPEGGSSVMFSRKLPWPMVFMVCATSPHIKLVLCKSKLRWIDRLLALLSHVILISGAHEMRKLSRVLRKGDTKVLCIFDNQRMCDYIKTRLEKDLEPERRPLLYDLVVERSGKPFFSELLRKRLVSISCQSA